MRFPELISVIILQRKLALKQILFFTALLVLFSGCASKEPTAITYDVPVACKYYSLHSAECLDEAGFIDTIEPYAVIFVGDHHQSKTAHNVVTELVNGLSGRGYKIALANEWFSPQDDALLEQYSNGELDSNGSKALGWAKRAGYDFNLSKPIFDAVIANGGTLYGINMDQKFKKMVSEQNSSAMSEEQRTFYENLDLNVTVHQQLVAPFFSHCHHLKNGETQEECSARMYRVQVAWDSMMGQESAKLAQGLQEKEKLIVFVGAMHLESKVGVNLRFARKTTTPSLTILPVPRVVNTEPTLDVAPGSCDIVYLYND